MLNLEVLIDQELEETRGNDISWSNQFENKNVPEQKWSVGERELPLVLPFVEHTDENELESRGGSDRRPSEKFEIILNQ